MLYYFSLNIDNLRALKHINVSHNSLDLLKKQPNYEECNITYHECSDNECNTNYTFCNNKEGIFNKIDNYADKIDNYKDCYIQVIEKCIPQTVDTFDLSDVGEGIIKFLFSSFFHWIQFKKIHLRNNGITSIDSNWKIFNESLQTLDLRQNKIKSLYVSTIIFKKLNQIDG